MATSPPLGSQPSEKSLWFGFATSAAAFTFLGFLDIIFVWQFCTHQTDYGMHPVSLGVRWAFFLVALGLLALSVHSGVVSHGIWRRLSMERHVMEAQATERHEFMAALGVVVTIIMGMGIVWLALPAFIVNFCQRAR
jgi:hypothetical protein